MQRFILSSVMSMALLCGGCLMPTTPTIYQGMTLSDADEACRKSFPPYLPDAVKLTEQGTIQKVYRQDDLYGVGTSFILVEEGRDGTLIRVSYMGFAR